jgi:lipoic acid synthetase
MRAGKPSWLRTKIPAGNRYFKLKRELNKRNLSTICQAAKCPNVSECWNKNNATFLILGNVCTRNCSFCSVPNLPPNAPDPSETDNIIEMIKIMGLKYAVITSVTRDDLSDGGSLHFQHILKKLKKTYPQLRIEVLIPDFKGDKAALLNVLEAGPDILNHNLETVLSCYPKVNREVKNYSRSLNVLKWAGEEGFDTKSGIMVGLGETKHELIQTLWDLYNNDVRLLTIGQYLQPTRKSIPVKKFYSPAAFLELKTIALDMGFIAVESGPFVRSSFNAHEIFKKKELAVN